MFVYIVVGAPVIKTGGLINRLNPATFVSLSQASYVVRLFVFSENVRIIRFVVIGRIDYFHCLKLLSYKTTIMSCIYVYISSSTIYDLIVI